MTTAVRLVQGDVDDVREFTLTGVEDLTTASAVEAHIWRKGVAAETLTASITSTVNRTVEVEYGGASGWLSDAAAVLWLQEIVVTFAGGAVLTWPAGPPDTVLVRADA